METIEWKVSNTPVPYPESVEFMTKTVQSIISGTGRELVWLLEHPDIYTRGSSARANELKYQPVAPIYSTGRGGRYTYHGPGQRVVYLMMDLRTRGRDIKKYVYNLESLLINTIGEFGIKGERRHGRIGVWVSQGNNMDVKLGAVGVRVRKWVTSHGISLNISPNLAMYDAIVPCGINGHGISSLQELGVPALMQNVDEILCQNFQKIFGEIKFTT